LASTLRAAGGIIVWVTPAPVAPDHPILRALWGAEHLQMIAAQTASGSAANDLADGLTPEPQDLAVYK
jgi:hypothetical protein